MSKEVTTTNTQLVGIASELSSDDCEKGRIAIMQGLSDLVKKEQARQGAIVNIVDGTELGYKDQPMEFIIVGIQKYWVETDADSKDFISKYPAISERDLPWEENVNGRNIKRNFHFAYWVVLPEDIKNGLAMPYELAFRSTELSSSRKLNNIIRRMGGKGISSLDKTFKMGSELKSNNKGNSWFGSTIAIGRDTTKEEKEAAAMFASEFSNAKALAQETPEPAPKIDEASDEVPF